MRAEQQSSTRWGRVRLLGAGALALLLGGLTACQGNYFTERPVVSVQEVGTHASLEELSAWAAEELDAVIGATGVETSWETLIIEPPLNWVADREQILTDPDRPNCEYESGRANPAAVQISLITVPLDQDPFPLLERMREALAERGWDVRNMYEPGQVQAKALDIIASKPDGSAASARASDQAGGKMLSFRLTSVCSDHPTVAW